MNWFTSGMGRYLDLTIFFSITFVFFGLAATPSISAPTPDWERDKTVQKANKACKAAPVTIYFLYNLRVKSLSLDSLTLDMDRDSFYKNSASLRQEIQDDPYNLSNYLMLANRLSFLSFKESSAYDEAMKLYQFVLSNDVTGKLTPSVNLGIGGILAIHEKYDQALSQYDQILQNPKSDAKQIAKAHAGRGMVLEQLCQEDAALSAYASAIYAHPVFDTIGSLDSFKVILKRQNRYDTILPFYQALLEKKTEVYYQTSVLDEIGTVLMQDFKQFDQAEKIYLRLIQMIEVNPNLKETSDSYYSYLLPDAYIKLGDSLRQQGKAQAALTAYTTGAKTYRPNNEGLDAYHSFTKNFQELGLLDLAILIYQKMVAFRPEDIHGFVELGKLYEQQSNFTEAITNYEKSISLKSSYKRDLESQQYARTQLLKLRQGR